ncbi:MAG: amylo-alpha-1,6-glucosidase [Syntrophothermus sp.]
MLPLLKNQIDITRVPFSDRGSRLLVYQYVNRPSFYVKLAERLIHVEPGIESYLRRPPFMDDLCLIGEDGQVLDFSLTTFPELLQLETRLGIFYLAFQDANTLVFGLPAGVTAGLRFRVNSTHWYRTETGGEVKHVRNMSYEILNGEMRTNNSTPGFPGVEILVVAGQDCSISLHTWDGPKREFVSKPFSIARLEAAERWKKWFERVPDVDEHYRHKYAYAWWVMANNLVNPRGYLTRPAMVPSKASYIGTWLWDSALHAIAYRHVDPELARDQVRVMLAQQQPDGMLPDAIFDEGVVTEIDHPIQGRVTKPPILAWAVLKIHEMHPDADFLREVYEPLVRENRWWLEQKGNTQDRLAQYTHPYSSGLDDSPLWDDGMPVISPDINTYLQIQMNSLADIAAAIGKREDARKWRERATALTTRMIIQLWDERTGSFQALHEGKKVPVLTPFNLLPIWTGQLPGGYTERLISHLTHADEFMGKFRLPTVAYNDPKFDPQTMWRGPVWANINYFFIEALQKIDRDDLASELRKQTLELIANQPGISEYYDSQTGVAPPRAIPAFGWTAAIYIELAIQASSEKTKKEDQSEHE